MRMGIPHALTLPKRQFGRLVPRPAVARFWALWACFARLTIAWPKTASDRTAPHARKTPELGTSEKVHAAGVDGTGAV